MANRGYPTGVDGRFRGSRVEAPQPRHNATRTRDVTADGPENARIPEARRFTSQVMSLITTPPGWHAVSAVGPPRRASAGRPQRSMGNPEARQRSIPPPTTQVTSKPAPMSASAAFCARPPMRQYTCTGRDASSCRPRRQLIKGDVHRSRHPSLGELLRRASVEHGHPLGTSLKERVKILDGGGVHGANVPRTEPRRHPSLLTGRPSDLASDLASDVASDVASRSVPPTSTPAPSRRHGATHGSRSMPGAATAAQR